MTEAAGDVSLKAGQGFVCVCKRISNHNLIFLAKRVLAAGAVTTATPDANSNNNGTKRVAPRNSIK